MPKLRSDPAHGFVPLRHPGRASSRLTPLTEFGENPGGLKVLAYAPASLPRCAPLVVVLHGCTQTAANYDHAAGWTTLAERHGFAVLFPEQVRGNNTNACFNWFEPGDTARGNGESASIVAAVAAMIRRHDLDPARVFVTGLSAGGAMAATLLATYPDVFAGGAVIAGLPYGSATGVNAALGAMHSPPVRAAPALGDKVRAASSFTGPWPRVMIWHGAADRTVAPANGDAVAAQWCDVHGLAAPRISAQGRESIERWADGNGVVQVELHRIAAMGHGTPVAAGQDGMHAAPFMLDTGICSSASIGAFWGIMPAITKPTTRPASQADRPVPHATVTRAPAAAQPRRSGFGDTINAALRAAGLLQ